MNDNLARKYDYYQIKPEVTTGQAQTLVNKKQKQLTKKQIIAKSKAKLEKKKKLEFRKKLTLIFMTLGAIFGTLGLGLYAFAIQRL
ncbi:MAG: hypothetical protein ACRCTZ_19150 [Sarcina sp.]